MNEESWEIWRYILNILNNPHKKLNEVKLLLVGDGAVGKTSLVNRLVNNKFNDNETKTDGINRKLWQLPLNNKDRIRVNIWDFGGQEIMHATHQFFLTKRSVYILVLDARQGAQESRLEYWLKIIESFGGNSPIIVVTNKCDEHTLGLNTPFLKNKYPSIQAFCNVSCKTAVGINELIAEITKQIDSLKEVKTLFPKTWFELKYELESLPDNYISYDRYEQLCLKHQITKPDDQKTLLSLLHNLGIMLNYRDDERVGHLVEPNVLKPEWVTNGVYKILNNNNLFQAKGEVNLNTLREILDEENYPSYRECQFIIDLMWKFELSFPFDGITTYLIPDLLQKKEPYLNWDEQNSLAFQYHYDVLPNSVISRFIVRMNSYIFEQSYWYTGVVLSYQSDSNKALIRADIEGKKIYIFVNGNQSTRREFLAVIRRDFECIHKTIKSLEVKEKIPYKTALIDYQHLLKLERLGEEYIIPESLEERVPVKKLLQGYEMPIKPDKTPVTNKIEKYLMFTFGIAFITAIMAVAWFLPNPTSFQYTVFRTGLALFAAVAAAMIPGALEIKIGNWLKATGAIAVFTIVYFKSPASLVLNPTEKAQIVNIQEKK